MGAVRAGPLAEVAYKTKGAAFGGAFCGAELSGTRQFRKRALAGSSL